MTPRQRAASAGEPTYLGGSPCSRGHQGFRYTANGNCVQCARSDVETVAAPDPRLRDLSGKLHEVRAEERQATARVKRAVRKFDAAPDDMKKWRESEAVGREHKTLEDLQRQAAGLELELEAARSAPDPMRLAALLAAAGAPPTPPPVRFELRSAAAAEIQAARERVCKDPDLLIHNAQMARDRLVRETVRARLMAEHLDNIWSAEEGERVRQQVKAEFGLTPLPSVEPDPRTEEQEALLDRLTRVVGQ